MEKIKNIFIICLMLPYLGLGQNFQLEKVLSQISTNGEIMGFVENCYEPKIYRKLPIIPPLLSSYQLNMSTSNEASMDDDINDHHPVEHG